MTNEQRFFLTVLSDHLNGQKTEAQGNLNWDELCEFAGNHEVNGIVYYQCRGFLPAQWEDRLSKKYSAELFYYYNRVALFRQIEQALSAANIPFFTVKGLDVAQHYPIPALRTMGDCDLVVSSGDKEKAHEVMTRLGFQNRLSEDKEWVYFKNDLEFEIHDHLLYDETGNTKTNRQHADRAWEHAGPTGTGTRYALDWSFHFLFLLLHLKKHLIHSGVGFRQFMDLDAVLRHCELDWDWIADALEQQGLTAFARICLTLIHRWFGTPLPFAPVQLDASAFEGATEKVFANGIFGFHDERNKENAALNVITQKRGPRWLIRLRRLFTVTFPSYRKMRFVPQYAFLNGRPWLLPAAWLYRFYRSIRYRMGANGKKMLENTMVSNERLDARKEELAKWGL